MERTRISKDYIVEAENPMMFQVSLLNSDLYLSGAPRNDYIYSSVMKHAIIATADNLNGVGLVYHKGDEVIFVAFPPGEGENFFWTTNPLSNVKNSIAKWMTENVQAAWASESIGALCVSNGIAPEWVTAMQGRTPTFSVSSVPVTADSEEEELETITEAIRMKQKADQRRMLLDWAEQYVPGAEQHFNGKPNKEIVVDVLALDETSKVTKPHPHRLLGRMIHQTEIIRPFRHANGETTDNVSMRWIVEERTPIGHELLPFVSMKYHTFYGSEEEAPEDEEAELESAIA